MRLKVRKILLLSADTGSGVESLAGIGSFDISKIDGIVVPGLSEGKRPAWGDSLKDISLPPTVWTTGSVLGSIHIPVDAPGLPAGINIIPPGIPSTCSLPSDSGTTPRLSSVLRSNGLLPTDLSPSCNSETFLTLSPGRLFCSAFRISDIEWARFCILIHCSPSISPTISGEPNSGAADRIGDTRGD